MLIHKLLLLLFFSMIGGLALPPAQAQTGASIAAELHTPAVAVRWMRLLYDRINEVGFFPPTAARAYGYAGIALYEGAVHGMANGESLGGRLNGLPELPQPDPDAVYDWAAVANAAAATVSEPILFQSTTDTLYQVTQLNSIRDFIDGLKADIIAERTAQVGGEVVARSTAYGEQIGAALAAWALADGFAATLELTYTPPLGEALWVPIPASKEAVEPYYSQVRPVLLRDHHECTVPLTVTFSTDIESDMYRQALEVYQMSLRLTDEQRFIADFWADPIGEGGMTPGHWVLTVADAADQLNLNLAQTAEAYALIGVGMMDAGLTTWTRKYETMVMRPETYIQRYIDPEWESYLDNPNFPEFPSGHAAFGGAVEEVLTALFGTVAYVDNGGVIDEVEYARSFTSFEAASYENAISRLYGGVHYRMGMEAGMRQGECIGRAVIERLRGEAVS